jgi:hypothetical protein
MRRALLACLLLSSPLFVAAVEPDSEPLPEPVLAPVTDVTLVNYYDCCVEAQLDADLNADGLVDVAAVMRNEQAETRRLVVMLGYRAEFDLGHEPLAEMAMDPYPLGGATLEFKNGVLIVGDLTGGTSAVSSTYRFRWDPAETRMRLIGDDVTYYSRTNNHDSLEISTNRLTGVRIRQVNKLNENPASDDDAAYFPQPEVRETVDKAPIWMEDAPAPDVTLGIGME